MFNSYVSHYQRVQVVYPQIAFTKSELTVNGTR
jgi:hypothetical protein